MFSKIADAMNATTTTTTTKRRCRIAASDAVGAVGPRAYENAFVVATLGLVMFQAHVSVNFAVLVIHSLQV